MSRTPPISERKGPVEPDGFAPLSAISSMRHAERSVRGKLIRMIMLTTALAVLTAGAAMLAYDLSVYRSSWAEDLATEANILAGSTAPALAFDDRIVAERNLSALRARPGVLSAALYTPNGRQYVAFVREGAIPPPAQLTDAVEGTNITGTRVAVTHRIMRNGEWLGTIYLQARYAVGARISAYLGIFALVTFFTLLVAFVLSTVRQRAITAPLEEIASAARRVMDARDYSLRARKSTDDEIGIVVDAFNDMLGEVQLQTRALQESEKLYRAIGESIDYGVWLCDAAGRNTYASESFLRLTGLTQEQCSHSGWASVLHPQDAGATMAAWQACVRTGEPWYREHRILGQDGRYHPVLAHGVATRDEANHITGWAGINLDIARLKETEDALREMDRRKDEFIATLVHELRNPLAALSGAAQLMSRAAQKPEILDLARDALTRQVKHMARLLDDLLDVSRITHRRLLLRLEPCLLSSSIREAIDMTKPLFDSKEHQFIVEMPHTPLWIAGDGVRLTQIICNLLNNAAKYTDRQGEVQLRVRTDAQWVDISIKDNGIGIAPEWLGTVFEMFSQSQSALERSDGGLGIGLSLVRGLVELHGGTVTAHSEGVGKGSEFIVRLPLALVGAESSASLGQKYPRIATSNTGKRVLVADDNVDSATSWAATLRLEGHDVQTAYDGMEALRIATEFQPQVALLDIGMPKLNGYELAQRIREMPWGGDALLIAMTGWGQESDKRKALDAGFDRHFTKPVDAAIIVRLLADSRA